MAIKDEVAGCVDWIQALEEDVAGVVVAAYLHTDVSWETVDVQTGWADAEQDQGFDWRIGMLNSMWDHCSDHTPLDAVGTKAGATQHFAAVDIADTAERTDCHGLDSQEENSRDQLGLHMGSLFAGRTRWACPPDCRKLAEEKWTAWLETPCCWRVRNGVHFRNRPRSSDVDALWGP